MNRLALGTVQFGLPYGLANRFGKVTRPEAKAMVILAATHGIDTIDTAIAYGDSESCLGEIGVRGFKVVTKLPAVPIDCMDVGFWVQKQMSDSFARLGVTSVYGLLLHRSQDLLGKNGPALYQALQGLKDNGLVEKLGISIYSPSELDSLIPYYEIDMVQAPFNLIDRRLIDSGWLFRLADQGIELHVRSVFLQGLLLLPASARPNRFSRWAPLWSRWGCWLNQQQITPLQACLRYVLGFQEVSKAIVGVESTRQLKDILLAAVGPVPVVPSDLAESDVNLINPANWHNFE